MDSLDKRIIDRAGRLFKRFKSRNILKTMEEVEANTNEENLPSAVVVGELINNLGGNILTYENGKYYIQAGADSASKKQLGSNFQITIKLRLGIGAGQAPNNFRDTTLVLTCNNGKVTWNDPYLYFYIDGYTSVSHANITLLSVTYKEL